MIIGTRTNSLACEHFVLLHTATFFGQYSAFFLLKYLNIRTKIFKYSNGSRFKYSDNSIFWYCTLKKFMLFSKLDKLTTQFDFDNALLSKKEHQWFWGIIFQLADDIYMTFSLNVCWLLKANVCFVLLGIIFSRPTSLLVGFYFYTNDFHSLNWSPQ